MIKKKTIKKLKVFMKHFIFFFVLFLSTNNLCMQSFISKALSVVGTDITPTWNVETQSKLNRTLIHEVTMPSPCQDVIARTITARYLQDDFALLFFIHKKNDKTIKKHKYLSDKPTRKYTKSCTYSRREKKAIKDECYFYNKPNESNDEVLFANYINHKKIKKNYSKSNKYRQKGFIPQKLHCIIKKMKNTKSPRLSFFIKLVSQNPPKPYNFSGTTNHMTSYERSVFFASIKKEVIWLNKKKEIFTKYSEITNVIKPTLKKEIKKLEKTISFLSCVENAPLVAFHRFRSATQTKSLYDTVVQTTG